MEQGSLCWSLLVAQAATNPLVAAINSGMVDNPETGTHCQGKNGVNEFLSADSRLTGYVVHG